MKIFANKNNMYSKQFKYSTFLLVCLLGLNFGCDKNDDLPHNQANGKIIAITGGCYGEIVLIEVESSNNIGLHGTFFDPDNEDNLISYQNGIAVPYFSKIGISHSVPQVIGTELHFEYRELTQEEREQTLLFQSTPLPICLANVGPPSANPFIITQVFNYK